MSATPPRVEASFHQGGPFLPTISGPSETRFLRLRTDQAFELLNRFDRYSCTVAFGFLSLTYLSTFGASPHRRRLGLSSQPEEGRCTQKNMYSSFGFFDQENEFGWSDMLLLALSSRGLSVLCARLWHKRSFACTFGTWSDRASITDAQEGMY